MLNLTRFSYKKIQLWVRSLRQTYHIFQKFGYLPPTGITISNLENIRIGDNFNLSPYCSLYCQDPENGSVLEIGNNVSLNHNVMINADCGGKIYIGNDCIFAPNVVIRASNHRYSQSETSIRNQGHEPGEIVIEDNVWIASNVVILPGV